MNVFFERENYFHPSILPYRGKLLLVMHRITAMDRFTPPFWCESNDGGRSWSGPKPIPTLERFRKCADFRPLPLPGDRTAGIIGLVSGEKGYKTVYLTFDGEWSEPEFIPGMTAEDDRAGGTQAAVASDGTLTVAFYQMGDKGYFTVVTRKYRSEGKRLVHLETGTPLVSPVGRGWYEPSLIWDDGTYYLTMRCDENCAMLSHGSDGLNWSVPEKWKFSDETLLETGPTQQHWMRKKDGIWLVYTRRDASNEDCFRWRTPMFAAPFNRETLRLDKAMEEIVIPRIDYRDRPGLLGNFNVTNLTDCAYVTDAPLWYDLTPDGKSIAWFSTSVVLKKITF